ncbi:hypothetical protein N7491_003317 [Penicillium cf. griseofulvum]|uniref:Uncharacterized protein n=1 Tax=Penicillium cf. griseofulvum TaxID=2972120 RepID=A0A9W9MRG3_9EURO|nr:hypothetical protein N7472_002511 [Penicillium cf. griseofulvum]KAJ5440911.1 hypothetical protein N7491_003317 [Penicillium cf. griseofulvum]
MDPHPPLPPTEEVSAPIESSPDPLNYAYVEGLPDPPSRTYTQCLRTLPLDQFHSEFRSGEVKRCQRCRDNSTRSKAKARAQAQALLRDPPLLPLPEQAPLPEQPSPLTPTDPETHTCPTLLTAESRLSDPAISGQEGSLIQWLCNRLQSYSMETCSRCRQRQLNTKLADGVCSDYRKAGIGQAVELFSALDNIQPDEMPLMLLELSQVEEIL